MAQVKAQKPPVTLKDGDLASMSSNERIKDESQGLFYVSEKGEVHTFLDEVEDLSRGDRVTLSGNAKEISKFFGIYRQQARGERGKKLDDHFLMVRIKCPGGGELTPDQWRALDDASDAYADGTLRITSRQAIQFHHVYGPKLAPLIRDLNRQYRNDGTLAACGDVNRNVMCSPVESLEPVHQSRGQELAQELAEELAPKSSSYFQIFRSDAEGRNQGPLHTTEPLYGPTYLPRKFKIGIAHPEDNAVDLLTQDVGLMPVVTNGTADGEFWDLYTGGGLGLTHNNPATAALLGIHLGRIRREQVVAAARAIATIQKENGDRRDRRQARWKYTLRRLGVEAVKAELKNRFELEIQDAPPVPLPPMRLHLGWNEQHDGKYWYGVSVESGRLAGAQRKAVRAVVDELGASVRLTPQQDLLLCNLEFQEDLERIFSAHGVPGSGETSLVRRNAMACPAKPTCGLAMTEAERILPSYLDAIEVAGYGDTDVVIRMTGCPNNCARPPSAEIGIYGYGKNDHVILVGGTREGTRLAHTLFERVPGEQMVPTLVGLFRAIAERNHDGLPVGEFLGRADPAQLREWIGVESAGG